MLNSDLFSNVAVPFTIFFEIVRQTPERTGHDSDIAPLVQKKQNVKHSTAMEVCQRGGDGVEHLWFDFECCSCIDLVSTVPMTRVLHICFIRCIPLTPPPCKECWSRVMSQYIPIQASWKFGLWSHFQRF